MSNTEPYKTRSIRTLYQGKMRYVEYGTKEDPEAKDLTVPDFILGVAMLGTGLKDSTGKEIFEKDIVQIDGLTYDVVLGDGKFLLHPIKDTRPSFDLTPEVLGSDAVVTGIVE